MTADSGILTENFPATAAPVPAPRARILVLGNEKGGSGKSTVAMHLTVGLLRAGLRVGTIDVDSRQATLTRYLENRNQSMERLKLPLPMSEHRLVPRSAQLGEAGIADETARLEAAIAELSATCQTIVIDTPGSDQTMSRVAHSYADTLITPMNDSFVDLDLLAKVEPMTLRVICPSAYSAMVWEQKKIRAKRNGESIDWLVLRNRLAGVDARNKRNMAQTLDTLARRFGFRQAPGLGDRVIFRELFLSGLTLLDLRERGIQTPLTMSHIAGRQEIRSLIEAIGLHAPPGPIPVPTSVPAPAPVLARSA
ncbi:MAG: AAA family ATPase [Magnetospirillum sp.]|jgi:chromosome partitioning protein|nr:AAA family ATPase [Magnetospirillum sp.]